jgi:hypothetical protein
MAKAEMQRRVYLLPSDLVDRVVRYQTERGMKSEVEAVRRLIDEALKMRDDDEDIMGRFLTALHENRDLNDAAREVLVGHPLVTEIKFHESIIELMIKGFGRFRSDYLGNIEKQDPATSKWSQWLDLDYLDINKQNPQGDKLRED